MSPVLELPEGRRELAVARMDALRRSAERVPPGTFRRAAGAALVRAGMRLGSQECARPFRSDAPAGASPRAATALRTRVSQA